jgi:hypothetical protein
MQGWHNWSSSADLQKLQCAFNLSARLHAEEKVWENFGQIIIPF